MFRKKFLLRNEAAADGGDNGGGSGAGQVTPSKWGIPEGAEIQEPSGGDDPSQAGDPAPADPAPADPANPSGAGGEGAGGQAPAGQQKPGDDSAAAPAPGEGQGGADGADKGSEFDLDSLPPFIKSAIEEHRNGKFNQDEFIQRHQGIGDVDKAPAEQVIKEFYTKKYGMKSDENPNGVSPEELDAYIAAQKEKNLLEFTAREFRPQLKGLMEQERQQAYDAAYSQLAESQEKNLQDLFAKSSKYDNIYGIKVGKADIEQFNEEVKGFFLPEKGEQLQPLYVTDKLYKLLSNDEAVYQMLYAATRNSQIKDALTGAKESTKRNIESKLGLTPNVGSGTSSSHNPGTVTPGLWATPEEF